MILNSMVDWELTQNFIIYLSMIDDQPQTVSDHEAVTFSLSPYYYSGRFRLATHSQNLPNQVKFDWYLWDYEQERGGVISFL